MTKRRDRCSLAAEVFGAYKKNGEWYEIKKKVSINKENTHIKLMFAAGESVVGRCAAKRIKKIKSLRSCSRADRGAGAASGYVCAFI